MQIIPLALGPASYPPHLYAGEPALSLISPTSVTFHVQLAAGCTGIPSLPSAFESVLAPGGVFGGVGVGRGYQVPVPWSAASSLTPLLGGGSRVTSGPASPGAELLAGQHLLGRQGEDFRSKGFTFGFLPSLEYKLQAVSAPLQLRASLCLPAWLRNITPRSGCAGTSLAVPQSLSPSVPLSAA